MAVVGNWMEILTPFFCTQLANNMPNKLHLSNYVNLLKCSFYSAVIVEKRSEKHGKMQQAPFMRLATGRSINFQAQFTEGHPKRE